MSKNKLTDNGLVVIMKALSENTSIENMNLQGNKLTDKCVDTIVCSLKTNKILKTLDLQNNGIISRLMKNKLKNSLPQIKVLV